VDEGTNAIPRANESLDQVAADEPAGARYQHASIILHSWIPFVAVHRLDI
jgi:hypothetical protein